MNRTPIKRRRTYLKRYTPLRRTPLRRRKPDVPFADMQLAEPEPYVQTIRLAPLRRTGRLKHQKTGRLAELRRQADRLWADAVRRHAHYICEDCGSAEGHHEPLDAHHQVPRRYTSKRWLVSNGAALCRVCHDIRHAQGWQYQVPVQWRPTEADMLQIIETLKKVCDSAGHPARNVIE